jgi:hypothetical protein
MGGHQGQICIWSILQIKVEWFDVRYRDFGLNTWPNFMFAGEDGIRRHAVGADLLSLDQKELAWRT